MNRTAFFASVGTGLVGAVLLGVYVKRFEAEVSGGPKVAVLMATQEIPLGAALTESMVGVRELPQLYVEERHIRASDLKQIVGVRVSMGVKPGESLLWTDLATTSEQRRDLSGLLRPGMRAITIRADATSSFGGLLRPGDRVDVLLTTARPGVDGATVPLLQNVLVLAVGRDTGAVAVPDQRKPAAPQFNQITLSVTIEQAQLLSLAGEQGKLALALRNPDDIAVIEGLPEVTPSDILQAEKRAVLQRRDRPQAQTKTGIERVR